MSQWNPSQYSKYAFPDNPSTIRSESKGLTKLEWMVGQVLPATTRIYSDYDGAVEAAIELSVRALEEIEKRQS